MVTRVVSFRNWKFYSGIFIEIPLNIELLSKSWIFFIRFSLISISRANMRFEDMIDELPVMEVY